MDQSQMGLVLAAGIGSLVLVIFIYPLILSAANRYINGFWAHYGRAIGTVVLTSIIVGIIGFIIGKAMGAQHFWAGLVIGIVLETLIGGALMNAFIKHSDGAPLGFKRAALAYLVVAIIAALVSIAMRPTLEHLRAMSPAATAPATTSSVAPANAMSAPSAASTAPTMVAPPATPEKAASAPTPAASAPASGSTSA